MAKKLSFQRKKAIAGLMSTSTLAEAAEVSGVSPRSISRWLADDEDFRAALSEAESEAISAASRRIAAAADDAINALWAIVKDTEAEPRERIAAASAILGNLPKLRLLGGLEQAIIELQASVQL